jgi:SsrA-binding protein
MAKSKKKMSPSDETEKVVCRNKRATFDYQIEERYEAGMVLVGSEVKSLRAGKASVAEAYAKIDDDEEVWLEGAHINEYPWAHTGGHEATRRRKLLLKRSEIEKLAVKVNERGYTLVPIAIYFRDGFAKCELGLGRGKKMYDKRDSIKERDVQRDVSRDMQRYK